MINQRKLVKQNVLKLNCTGLKQGKFAEQSILQMIKPFASKIKQMQIKCDCESCFPKIIKVIQTSELS